MPAQVIKISGARQHNFLLMCACALFDQHGSRCCVERHEIISPNEATRTATSIRHKLLNAQQSKFRDHTDLGGRATVYLCTSILLLFGAENRLSAHQPA